MPYPRPKSYLHVPTLIKPYDVRTRPMHPPIENPFFGNKLKLCINAAWWSHLTGLFDRLRYRDAWAGTDEEIENAIRTIDEIEASLEDCTDSGCRDFLPSAPFISYAPNDPFRTPNLTPENYGLPPWYTNALISIPNVLSTDAMVNAVCIISEPFNLWNNFINQLEIIKGDPGLPRFTITVSGNGQVEIELVKQFQGGLVVFIEDNLLTSAKVVDLNSRDSLDVEDAIQLISGAIGSEATTTITEFNFADGGQHTITGYFVPNFNPLPGFGGGIRRVSLCGLKVLGEVDMFKLRQNSTNKCLLEQSLDGGETWATAFNYALCKPVATQNRYTSGAGGRLVYQESTDGGQTWQDAPPESDIRNNAGTLPPLSGSTAKCDGACSATEVIKQEILRQSAFLAGSADSAGFAGGIMAFLATIGISIPIVGIIIAIGVGVVLALGYTAFQAAFSDTSTWDKLRCHLHKYIADDGSFDAAAWNNVKNSLADDLSGFTKDHIWRLIDLMGAAGLTNAARIGAGSGCSDCADCAETWCKTFDFAGGMQGWTFRPIPTGECAAGQAGSYSGGGLRSEIYVYGGNTEWRHDGLSFVSPTINAKVSHVEVSYTLSRTGEYGGLLIAGTNFGDNFTYYPNVISPFTTDMSSPDNIVENVWFHVNDPNGYHEPDHPIPSFPMITITSVKMWGNGANPFGADNCTP